MQVLEQSIILDFKTANRSDMCENNICLKPIVSSIHKIKLFLLLKLCSLNRWYLTKQIFLMRRFLCLIDKKPIRIYSRYLCILCTYKLSEYLLENVREWVFPSKSRWKSTVHKAVDDIQLISAHLNFTRFANIHKTVSIAGFWKNPKSFKDIKSYYNQTHNWNSLYSTDHVVCDVCNHNYTDVNVHACCACSCTEEYREIWREVLIENYNCVLNYFHTTTKNYYKLFSVVSLYSVRKRWSYILCSTMPLACCTMCHQVWLIEETDSLVMHDVSSANH